MKEELEIIICGDICPTSDTEKFFENGDAAGLFNDVLDITKRADLTIGNLEFPLTDEGIGIKKTGPVLKGETKYIEVMKEAGFDVFGLANNHIRDCGDEGVVSTINACKKAGIETVGAGSDKQAARKPLIVNRNGWNIGVIAFAEHEFNAATKARAGANLFDVFESFDEIRDLKTKVDYLIVLYHGGNEYYEYPSSELQKKCRKMVGAGADLVLCQHSHCIGTAEDYDGGRILYGQGNTIYGYRRKSDSWNKGLILKIKLQKDGRDKRLIDYLPIETSGFGISLIPEERRLDLLKNFEGKSKLIGNEEFIRTAWLEFCKSKQSLYFPWLFGLGRYLNKANRVLGNRLIRLFYSKKRLNTVLNLIRCEAHQEVIRTILEEYESD